MAQRDFKPYLWSILNGLTLIRGHFVMSGTTPVLQKWTYPAPNSGAIGSYSSAATGGGGGGGFGSTAGAEGVKSVARTGAGLWTVVLQDNYQRLLNLRVHQALAGGLSTIVAAGNNTTITSMTTAGGSTIGVALLSSTGTAADPGDTTFVTLEFELQNSTAP